MAGVTAALMIAGTALSAAQTVKGLADQAKADQAAAAAKNQAARVAEADYSKNLRVPTLGLELAQQNIARQQADLTRAAREQGPAGVLGAIPAVTQSGIESNLQLAAEADRMQAQRNAQQAEMQQGIEQRRAAREYDLAGMGLQGAQAASAEARANQMAGVQGAIGSLGSWAQLNEYDKLFGQKTPPSTSYANIPTAQEAFAPQLALMRPQNIQPMDISSFGAPAKSNYPWGNSNYMDNLMGNLYKKQ